MKIGILTGGGDCPGLNSVIYGIMLKAFNSGHEIIGIEKGWKGFLDNIKQPLIPAEHDDLHIVGGTILFTSRTNPYENILKIKDKIAREEKIKEKAIDLAAHFKILGIDALIVIGGDDTLGVAASIYKHTHANIIGVPKTIDNDLSGTDYTFGFWSAVQLATNTIDNLQTTAYSHQRTFVVEIMGRDAGWLTAMSGVSSGADVILIPEEKFDLEHDIVNVLKERINSGYIKHIIACSEGATPTDESLKRDFKTISKETIGNLPKDVFGNPLLAKLKIAKIIVDELTSRTDLLELCKEKGVEFEVRDVVLGHTMRAGSPNAFDRFQGFRLGMHAAQLVEENLFGKMVAIRGDSIRAIDLTEGIQKRLIANPSDIIDMMNLITSVKYRSKDKNKNTI
ncbi:MAG: 6-phosphofructokinase 1 [Candidatus Heimdallarchaeota archaeon LC_3]|nr:MAG: 6-phosphofructokinase 1 [Candidatus Heimdallarchaeota archaeon LC_3]